MNLHVSHVVMDCADPERLAVFWAEFVGVRIKSRWKQYVMLEPSGDGAPGLAFQRVDEVKTVKNRAHVDFTVADLEATTRRAVALGASVVDETTEEGVTVRVMADPEGNEFCLVRLPSGQGASETELA